jgi:hypothetical protein
MRRGDVGCCASPASGRVRPRARTTASPIRRMSTVEGRLKGSHLPVGIVNVNVEPAPSWLFTQIRPPCSSMNFRHRVSPSPSLPPSCPPSPPGGTPRTPPSGPPGRCPPRGRRPIPGQARPLAQPDFRSALPSGVNLSAFDNRFKIQEWTWDFRADPSDAGYGRMTRRVVVETTQRPK